MRKVILNFTTIFWRSFALGVIVVLMFVGREGLSLLNSESVKVYEGFCVVQSFAEGSRDSVEVKLSCGGRDVSINNGKFVAGYLNLPNKPLTLDCVVYESGKAKCELPS